MPYDFKNTQIWNKSFDFHRSSATPEVLSRIESAYCSFWDNAVELARQIQTDLPSLTLHDERHLLALWERADQLVGDQFILNPLELFVFGGGILLHDAANCVAAYDGGTEEIQATPEWKDAYEDWRLHSHNSEVDSEAILLSTLRSIHARRAQELHNFRVGRGDEVQFLISDTQLRVHLGELIGTIAASHHWYVDEIACNIRTQLGALAGFPARWTIRPVLLACLLRCADAVQLDQSRVPDFLQALLSRNSISQAHWLSQNRLAAPFVDLGDENALVFTSTKSFSADQSDAWWVAHDAIKLANLELTAVDGLLRDLRLPTLAINRIAGADAPDRLAKHVEVEGWIPVDARPHVSNVPGIIEMFGGDKLYGRHAYVAIRELIQNSADAIRMRRALEADGSDYRGRIMVTLSGPNADGLWSLSIEDDGIGMSSQTMTGPLIDFGASFLSSNLAKTERPGLVAKHIKRTGRFGIGFYSSFMISNHIAVTSKVFDGSISSANTLLFRSGLSKNPVLSKDIPYEFGANTSTLVRLLITERTLDSVLTIDDFRRPDHKLRDIEQLIELICATLDVDVYLNVGKGFDCIHNEAWPSDDFSVWLKKVYSIHSARSQENIDLKNNMDDYVNRLQFIDPDEPGRGLACIGTSKNQSGLISIGMLRAFESGTNLDSRFFGVIDCEPSGPKRDASALIIDEKLITWAKHQLTILDKQKLDAVERFTACCSLAEFGVAPRDLIILPIGGDWVELDAAIERMQAGFDIILPLSPYESIFDEDESEDDLVGNIKFLVVSSIYDDEIMFDVDRHEIEPNDNVLFLNDLPSSEKLLSFIYPNDITEGNDGEKESEYLPEISAFSYLFEFARSRGLEISYEYKSQIKLCTYSGPSSERDGLYTGAVISGSAIRLYIDH